METIKHFLQTIPAWVGLGISHFVASMTVSNVASYFTIAYSIAGFWFMWRKNRAPD